MYRLLILITLALSACSGMRPTINTGERYVTTNGLEEDYKLGVGDKIRVIVFGEETLSGEFQVGSTGNLALPLIGDVPATGHTITEVAKTAETKLADGYLRNPQVSMEVLTYRPYFILGEVKTPGQYPYANGLTVMNAIATAEGFTPRAERQAVFIRRSGEAEEKRYDLSPDLKVWPGDTIRLGERIF